MRTIIIYSDESKGMEAVVQALSSSIQAMGHEVHQVKAEKSARAESLFLYDLGEANFLNHLPLILRNVPAWRVEK